MESILSTVKRIVGGISEEDTSFDEEILVHTNAVFMILKRLGVGPEEGYFIKDKNDKWEDFIPGIESSPIFEAVKSYVGLKVRMLFDPPTGTAQEAFTSLIAELEFTLHIEADPKANV